MENITSLRNCPYNVLSRLSLFRYVKMFGSPLSPKKENNSISFKNINNLLAKDVHNVVKYDRTFRDDYTIKWKKGKGKAKKISPEKRH